MIGDFFGGTGNSTLTIQPPSFLETPPAVNVPLSPVSSIVSFSLGGTPYGQTRPTFTVPAPGNQSSFRIDSLYGTTLTSPADFTGPNLGSQLAVQPNGDPFTGVGLVTVDPTVGSVFQNITPNPDLFPLQAVPGAGFDSYLATGDATLKAARPSVAQQQQQFINANGPGTFTTDPISGETVTPGVVAVIHRNNPNGSNTVDRQSQFAVQSTFGYIPGTYGFQPDDVLFAPAPIVVANLPSPSNGGVVGRMKIAENSSPIPRDRVFFNYSYFDNVPLSPGGVNVNRMSPGLESTFLGGLASIEYRMPFASTLDTDIFADGVTNTSSTQLGNFTAFLKGLLYYDESIAIAGGLGIAAPTAEDVNVFQGGTSILRIENEAVHILPFVGGLWTPTDRLYMQTFLQFDVDANGNPVYLTRFANGVPTGNLTQIGRANDTTFFFGSVSAGYWLYQAADPGQLMTGLAPIVEVHCNRSLKSEDVVAGTSPGGGSFQVGSGWQNVDVLNATLGLTATIGRSANVTFAYVAPIGGGADQQFDGELRLFANWFFGP